MDKLQWFFELVDRVSPGAKSAQASLDRVGKQLRKLETTTSAGFGAKISRTLGSLSSQVGSVMGSLQQSFGNMGALISGAAIAGLGALGGKWMVDTLVFKENTMTSLEAMLGSKEAAERVFKMGTEFAAKTPFSSGQIGSAFEKLVAAGVKEDDLTKIMSTIGDLAGTDAQKIDRAIMAIAQIKGKGKLQTEELMQLAEMGLPLGKILDDLAKTMGKSKDEVQKLLEAGKISPDQGIGAIMNVVNATFGGRMEKASNSLAGLWSTLQAAPGDLLMSLDMEPMVAPVKSLIRQVTTLLAPDAVGGKMLAAVFTKVGEVIGQIAGTLQSVDWAKWLGKVGDIAERVWPKLEKLFAGFAKAFGLDDAGGSFESVLESISKWVDSIDPKTMEQLGQVLGYVLYGVIKLFEWSLRLAFGLGEVVHSFLSFWTVVGEAMIGNFDPLLDKLDGFWTSLKARFVQGGWDLVQGLIEGLLSGMNPAGGVIDTIGQTLIDRLESKLGINSPSTVAHAIGRFFGIGFLNGKEDSGMDAAIANPITPAQVAAGSAAAAGGAGTSVTIQQVIVQVGDGVKDAAQAREHGKAAADSFGAQFTSILKGFSAEAGG